LEIKEVVAGVDIGGTNTVFGLADKTIIVFLVLQVSEKEQDKELKAHMSPGK
jgi:predicted NBD/HSP70 family sugar kinase